MLSNRIVTILGTIVAILLIILIMMGIHIYVLSNKVEKLTVELGVVAGLSQNQEVKIVESKKIEERIKVLTQDKIKYVTEYIYDENKTECDNAIDRMRTVF